MLDFNMTNLTQQRLFHGPTICENNMQTRAALWCHLIYMCVSDVVTSSVATLSHGCDFRANSFSRITISPSDIAVQPLHIYEFLTLHCNNLLHSHHLVRLADLNTAHIHFNWLVYELYPECRNSIRGKGKDVSLLRSFHRGSGSHADFYQVGAGSLLLGGKARGAWTWPLIFIYCRGYDCELLYFASPYAFMAECLALRYNRFSSYCAVNTISLRYKDQSTVLSLAVNLRTTRCDIKKILRSAHTLHLCVIYGSQSK
jgi:hypothetical protein